MAEDHQSAREAYLALLATEDNFMVLGGAPNGYELLKLLEKREPDIALVDVEMPVMDGFKTIQELKIRFPNVKPIVLTMHDERHYIAQLILCGARAYLPKSCSMQELVEAINKVFTDGFYFSESLARAVVVGSFADQQFQKQLRHIDLSGQEVAVLRLLCEEKTVRQISQKLHLAADAVERCRRHIYRKTQARGLAGLIKYAIRNGIVPV